MNPVREVRAFNVAYVCNDSLGARNPRQTLPLSRIDDDHTIRFGLLPIRATP
jgi:hypothetical protein